VCHGDIRPVRVGKGSTAGYRHLLQGNIFAPTEHVPSIMPTRPRTFGSVNSLLSHACVLTRRSSTQWCHSSLVSLNECSGKADSDDTLTVSLRLTVTHSLSK
jgi:hypothetical protein